MNDAQAHRCACCNQPFKARSQSPRQAYCTRRACQRERRRRWQRAKRLTDPDYQTNQRKAQRAWSQRHPRYWAQYRDTHPAYCEHNRSQQRLRRRACAPTLYLKINSIPRARTLPAGLYRLIPVRGKIAKKNSWETEIHWVSVVVGIFRKRCKETIR